MIYDKYEYTANKYKNDKLIMIGIEHQVQILLLYFENLDAF